MQQLDIFSKRNLLKKYLMYSLSCGINFSFNGLHTSVISKFTYERTLHSFQTIYWRQGLAGYLVLSNISMETFGPYPNQRSLNFGPVKNVHGDICYMPKGHWNFGPIEISISICGPCQTVLDIWSCQKCPYLKNVLVFKQPIMFIHTFGL